jgi:hypothetical protein
LAATLTSTFASLTKQQVGIQAAPPRRCGSGSSFPPFLPPPSLR